MPSDAATIEDLLQPLRDDPEHSAVLLDVDGVLAPIVAQPDDAHMPETTRRPLIEVARRYGTVACVSGRRASDARRIVSLGSIAYLGSHGSEVLMPGTIAPVLDSELQAWTRRVQAFAHDAFGEKLRRLRVRLEDKEAIAALHWRGVPDEDDAHAAIEQVAEAAEAAGFVTHWGRKVLEIRPPVRIDKGAGLVEPAGRDGPRRGRLRRRRRDRPGRLPRPHGPAGARPARLRGPRRRPLGRDAAGARGGGRHARRRPRGRARAAAGLASLRFGDFLKATVLLSAASATLLAALTVIGLSQESNPTATYVCFGWWALATAIGTTLGSRNEATHAIANLLAGAKTQHSLPDISPARTIFNRLWPLLVVTVGAERAVGVRAADRRHRGRLRDHLGARLAAPGGRGGRDRGARRRPLLRR